MTASPPAKLTRRTAMAMTLAAAAWRPAWAATQPDPARSEALHVLNRLAFGPTPEALDRIAKIGTRAWISEQMHPQGLSLPDPLVRQLGRLRSRQMPQGELVELYRQLQMESRQAKAAGLTAAEPRRPRELAVIAQEAGTERLLQAVHSPCQLQEVLVDFWFNHFNVFQGKGLDRVLVGSYEREAIRPHVFGRFRAMLGATAKHPAMLFYLDNWLSVAPGWQPRRRLKDEAAPVKARGLNENYARELMELHTLGVDGGYTQTDVSELARIFTGWTMAHPAVSSNRMGRRANEREFGERASLFVFDSSRHDTGVKNWLGHRVEGDGQLEGEFALDVLARHPATARHLAFKLARRFVRDDPPQALVDHLAARFLATDGDLRAVIEALVGHPEFLGARQAKFKTPYQYVISAVRACGITATNVRPLQAQLAQMGQPLYGCPTPDGWHDTEPAWLNPEAITQRINFSTALAAGRMALKQDEPGDTAMPGLAAQGSPGTATPIDAAGLLETLGPALSDRTRATVAAAEPGLRAALILGSPDFMRC